MRFSSHIRHRLLNLAPPSPRSLDGSVSYLVGTHRSIPVRGSPVCGRVYPPRPAVNPSPTDTPASILLDGSTPSSFRWVLTIPCDSGLRASHATPERKTVKRDVAEFTHTLAPSGPHIPSQIFVTKSPNLDDVILDFRRRQRTGGGVASPPGNCKPHFFSIGPTVEVVPRPQTRPPALQLLKNCVHHESYATVTHFEDGFPSLFVRVYFSNLTS